MSVKFDRDTAVTPISVGLWRAHVHRDWWIVDGPNGGTIAAILLRAMEGHVADPSRQPRTLTVHYLRRPVEGEASVETTVERSGRTLSTVSARLLQGSKLVAFAIAACSTPRTGPEFCDLRMPEFPPPEQCPLGGEIPGRLSPLPFHGQWEVRPVLGDPPRSNSAGSTVGGWIRLAESRAPDPALIAQLADAWTPSIFPRMEADSPRRPVPTIELTVHFREPLPGECGPDDPFLVVFRSEAARNGFMEESGEIWSPSGALIAQSRQLAAFA